MLLWRGGGTKAPGPPESGCTGPASVPSSWAERAPWAEVRKGKWGCKICARCEGTCAYAQFRVENGRIDHLLEHARSASHKRFMVQLSGGGVGQGEQWESACVVCVCACLSEGVRSACVSLCEGRGSPWRYLCFAVPLILIGSLNLMSRSVPWFRFRAKSQCISCVPELTFPLIFMPT